MDSSFLFFPDRPVSLIAERPPLATPSGASVRLRDLRKDFGGVEVLRGLDLDIPAGQFLAIVGRSGCGKSTLLRILTGLESPSSGEVTLTSADNRRSLPQGATRLMFQEPRLLPWASIRRNVEVGLPAYLPSAARQGQADAALREVGLGERATEWPSVLSGGQKQRVALARALVSSPGLLALDEPLGALDALTRIEMQRLVESVWIAEGFTAILVTHDVSEAVMLADRIILLDQGRVALDMLIEAPRPRRHGDAALARTEGQILERLLGEGA
jgi:sulfonate transport system ATP-binding protein